MRPTRRHILAALVAIPSYWGLRSVGIEKTPQAVIEQRIFGVNIGGHTAEKGRIHMFQPGDTYSPKKLARLAQW